MASYPTEQTAIITQILIPIMLMSGVICPTQADCSELKPPKKIPYRMTNAMMDASSVIAKRHKRMMPVPVDMINVMLKLEWQRVS